jgi:hypothetical protein
LIFSPEMCTRVNSNENQNFFADSAFEFFV